MTTEHGMNSQIESLIIEASQIHARRNYRAIDDYTKQGARACAVLNRV